MGLLIVCGWHFSGSPCVKVDEDDTFAYLSQPAVGTVFNVLNSMTHILLSMSYTSICLISFIFHFIVIVSRETVSMTHA